MSDLGPKQNPMDDFKDIDKNIARFKKEKKTRIKEESQIGKMLPYEETVQMGEDVKPPSPFTEAFFRYVAIGFTVVPYLAKQLGFQLTVVDIVVLMSMLSWTVFQGWYKKISETKIKYWYSKFKREKESKDTATRKAKMLTEQVNNLRQQRDDLIEIRAKLMHSTAILSDQITKNLTKKDT